ncbi:DNA mismatch repair endonuclease MutL [Dehalogenimonas etheniformans]|uniref:DNA mismatch repair protein MutL n=1 Tax=Dehalogenimonas etheniformans TaxID=1536648 RepID=A0A2P5P870_9CHLR|nr:DNA mismatch repair endonuclease MutL [Dehalogenimonas etheniformans]PPD58498.1 DNA mismatch repair endonuclease MutL [Dehalogenimonas etheniformans]QNT76738.1 DNA mismatch repair endonuclease MutL [Dehalogenimonas etheniformans]
MPIRVLDHQTVARIAAGEVVERPASVVKELLENSIDAGSHRIDIEIKGGGAGLIKVSDDGCGILSDELPLAFARHATSKLSSFDDLSSIGTLGFRGEALGSIAAVAEVEVTTAVSGSPSGKMMSLRGGRGDIVRPIARACGTTISVSHLFREVPARLKFLKSDTTETGHIVTVVSNYSLAYPEVRFKLIVDGRDTLMTPGNGKLRDTAIEILGHHVAARMIEISAVDGSFSIAGLVSAPENSRANRTGLFLFVNRRWVRSHILSRAIEEACHGLLTVGRYPNAIINLRLPPSDTDINIHPAKTEIKFREDGKVFEFVRQAVRAALLGEAPVPSLAVAAPTVADAFSNYRPSGFQTSSIPTDLFSERNDLRPTPSQAIPALRPLGQVAGCYILAEGPDGLYIIDQHAAHERIMYEKVIAGRKSRIPSSQAFLEPQNVELFPAEMNRFSSLFSTLAAYGFIIESFGERSLLVRAIPQALSGGDWQTALHEFLNSPESLALGEERLAELIACHSAVRAGKVLSMDEIRVLLLDLEKAQVPNACPHGRPTLMKLEISALERFFKRT